MSLTRTRLTGTTALAAAVLWTALGLAGEVMKMEPHERDVWPLSLDEAAALLLGVLLPFFLAFWVASKIFWRVGQSSALRSECVLGAVVVLRAVALLVMDLVRVAWSQLTEKHFLSPLRGEETGFATDPAYLLDRWLHGVDSLLWFAWLPTVPAVILGMVWMDRRWRRAKSDLNPEPAEPFDL